MAKKDTLFDIALEGLDELEEEFEKVEKEFEDVLIDEYTKYGLLVGEQDLAVLHSFCYLFLAASSKKSLNTS
ncbi:hypothetical protein [Halobacillus seohaensis]|uniref:Uncharacterized protein n=1 Tax=Halobacillus seohaensis TaxID=447421 RepID=A0ABW2ERB4_9BACI